MIVGCVLYSCTIAITQHIGFVNKKYMKKFLMIMCIGWLLLYCLFRTETQMIITNMFAIGSLLCKD